jgi:peroxidase
MKISLFTFWIVLIGNTLFGQNVRALDGTNNNLTNTTFGAVNQPFIWATTVDYGDGISTPAGQYRPSSRTISNLICHQDSFMANELGLSDFVWTWGQFIDHDMMLSVSANPSELVEIPVPMCDIHFDPNCTGTVTISMRRAEYDLNTGTSIANPRTPINRATAFLDASVIYGSEPFRLAWMRTYQNGKMKESSEGLLPYNTVTGKFGAAIDPNAPSMALEGGFPQQYFVSGDIRANEQPTLTCLHILFVREHNRLCNEIQQLQPSWTDEQIFQRARKVVGALIQAITYEEFLPTIGVNLTPYNGYDATINPGIMNSFSGAAFRFGHSAVTGTLVRYDEEEEFSFGSVDLRTAYTNPAFLKDEGGIEPFLRGLAAQQHQRIDTKVTSDLRNFLFGNPAAGGLDLVALNIERGREKGLPSFNLIRQNFGLSPINDFSQITSDILLQQQLQQLYGTVDSIDAWIGLMAEDHQLNSIFGACMSEIMRHQFEAIRDGDRLYYENDISFSTLELAAIQQTRLADVIRRNTTIQTIQDSVFIARERNLVNVEFLAFKHIKSLGLRAFPNPTQRFFTLQLEAIRAGKGDIIIINELGQVVKSQVFTFVTGENEVILELDESLVNGLYTINVSIENDKGSLRILKMRQ